MQEYLITGSGSGLGAFLLKTLKGTGLTRKTSNAEKDSFKREGFKTIVHCAFNNSKNLPEKDALSYFEDNLFLTRELLNIPHERFVFTSSVEVYGSGMGCCKEDSEILVSDLKDNVYALTKFLSERLVLKEGVRPLVVRLPALVGEGMRKNSLTKILSGETANLTLSGESSFNYLPYETVQGFLVASEGASGIFNLCSTSNVFLKDLARKYNSSVIFGEHIYTTPQLSILKTSSIFQGFLKTSLEVVEDFKNQKK